MSGKELQLTLLSQVVTRAIIFLDGLMYGYSSAFTNFITAGGLAIFVDRTKVRAIRRLCAPSANS